MGVLLQAFYSVDHGHKGVPCPLDGDHGADVWWDHLAKQAHALRRARFHGPGIPQDPNVFQDFSFGSDLAPINGKPQRYVFNGLLASADWVTRALDLQGFRVDDVKGISTDFLLPLLNHGALKGKFAVGEFFDGQLDRVRAWVSGAMQGRSSAFDFPLRDFLLPMCNNAGFFDMAR